MSDLPPLAWALLCAVVVILVVMNLALVALVRNRNNIKIAAMPPRQARPQPGLDNIAKVLRDPFSDERKQLNELSERIHDLDEKSKQDPDQ